jgi:hypothetical protein
MGEMAEFAAEEAALLARLRDIRDARAALASGMTSVEQDLARCSHIVRAYATPKILRRIADRMESGLEARGGAVSEDPAGYLSCCGSTAVALIPWPSAQLFPYGQGWL